MFVVILLLCISGFFIYKMFRPIFKTFFIVTMVIMIVFVAVAAVKDGFGIEDEVQTTEQTQIISEEDVTLKDYLTGVNL